MTIRVQVMGPFNTGTNLLLQMMQDNCVDEDENPVKSSENMLFWKHTLRTDFIGKALESPDNRFIIMYKRVYNWVYSVQRNSYDIQLHDGIYDKVTMQGRCYDNILQLYNRYYDMYKEMLLKHPDQVIFLDYGKMISSPEYIVKRLSQIGLTLKDKSVILAVLSKPSKIHGKGNVMNAKEALDRYEQVFALVKIIVDNHSMSSCLRKDLMDWFDQDE